MVANSAFKTVCVCGNDWSGIQCPCLFMLFRISLRADSGRGQKPLTRIRLSFANDSCC